MRVALVDVGLGNLHSVERALRASGATDVAIVSDPDLVQRADALVVPGQGAVRDCATALAGGLGEAIAARIRTGVPYLGICLGMQALFDSSDEAPGSVGLGVFRGRVRKLEPKTKGDKVPHTGWNTVEPEGSSLLPKTPTYFYFVHSYVAEPSEPIACGITTHGVDRFVSAIARDNVFAVQFHPEKSQTDGLRLLERWIKRV